MFVVAIAELAGRLEDEATALGADLGATPYDARMLLVSGLPAVVRTTGDKAQALDLLARLRARGHGAVACDSAAVVASGAMVAMRRFRLGPAAVTLDDRSGEALPYDDVLALLPAVHRTRAQTETSTSEKKLSIARAVVTSGLSMTKTVKKESHASTEERDNVLYLFRRSGAPPWLLREGGVGDWSGHGQPLAASRLENFRLTVGALRAKAPGATFDDRLVTRKVQERASLAVGAGSKSITSSSDASVDLLAHLLALWIARSAYR
ncbi:MAG TPA: hypothetical protein VMI75_38270 [Polyangiaceae bacterium]|nr:hypothetical protein [Polyangiaceae bacterium]